MEGGGSAFPYIGLSSSSPKLASRSILLLFDVRFAAAKAAGCRRAGRDRVFAFDFFLEAPSKISGKLVAVVKHISGAAGNEVFYGVKR